MKRKTTGLNKVLQKYCKKDHLLKRKQMLTLATAVVISVLTKETNNPIVTKISQPADISCIG